MTQWRKFHLHYEVSSDGQVRSLPHVDSRGRPWPGKTLKQTGTGKCRRYLCVSVEGRLRKVHRLVAEAFLRADATRTQVNHKNGDPMDNRAENLEWCSGSENVRHSFNVLKKSSSGGHGGKTGALHHSSKRVIATDGLGITTEFGSAAEAARALNLAASSVVRAANGKYRHTGGYTFRWART